MHDGPFDSWVAFLNSQFLSSIVSFLVGLPLIFGLFRNANQTEKLVENAASEDAAKARVRSRETASQSPTTQAPTTDAAAAPINTQSPSAYTQAQSTSTSKTAVQPREAGTQSRANGVRDRHSDAQNIYQRAVGQLKNLAENETDGRYRRTYDRVLADNDIPALAAALYDRGRISENKFHQFIYLNKLWSSIGGRASRPLLVDDSAFGIFKKSYDQFTNAD